MPTRSATIIGAGIGGIAAACHLARGGWRVTVLEKNRGPGGRCDRYCRDGHVFDTGPTLLIMPLLYEAEFAALGTPLHEALDLQRVEPTYRLVFDDGRSLVLSSDLSSMGAQVEALEPGGLDGLRRYLAEGERHYNLAVPRLLNRDFRTAHDFFALENLPLLHQIKALVPHYRNMASYFHTSRLKAAFTFQDVYIGLSPFEAPATFSMMAYTEIAHGVWYPRGGMYRIVEALMQIARNAGVKFMFDTRVKRIDVAGNTVRGVTLADDRRLTSDIVIANADLPYVYKELLPDRDLARQMERKRFSCSVISFYWGVNKVYPALGPHTLFLADDYRQNFETVTRQARVPDNPSLYIHAPARLDPAMAPAGQDTLIAMVPVGHMHGNGERAGRADCAQARRHVLRRLAMLGITDLDAHLKFEMTYAPSAWRKQYNLMMGATHGLSHNLTQMGYFRPHNWHPRYRNLYFAGASTHPGTGIPTTLVSGRLVAQRIMDDFQT